MARPLRIEFPGALYHVTARGDRREAIFEDDEDRRTLLEVVGLALERFEASCHAYCLMPNHYHFVIETRRANLSRLMRHVNGVYTQRYNRCHDKVGHLFQGRFKAILVDRDAYFMEVCRYVDLNPLRAKLVQRIQDWEWSSYRAHMGLARKPDWLESGMLLGQLAGTPSAGQKAYVRFVAEGRGVRLWEEALNGQIYLGNDRFVAKIQKKCASMLETRDIPRAQRRGKAQALEIYLRDRAQKSKGVALAYREGGYTQSAIAKTLGLSVSRISRLIRAHEAKGKT